MAVMSFKILIKISGEKENILVKFADDTARWLREGIMTELQITFNSEKLRIQWQGIPIRSNTEIPIITGIHQLQMTEEKGLDTSLSVTLQSLVQHCHGKGKWDSNLFLSNSSCNSWVLMSLEKPLVGLIMKQLCSLLYLTKMEESLWKSTVIYHCRKKVWLI